MHVNTNDALDANDLVALRQIYTQGTSFEPHLRHQIWSLVMPFCSYITSKDVAQLAKENFENHRDYQQVVKDVQRSFTGLERNVSSSDSANVITIIDNLAGGNGNCESSTDSIKSDTIVSVQTYEDKEKAYYVDQLKERLLKVIMSCLTLVPDLYYYQGFHDVASLVIMTFPQDSNMQDTRAILFLCSFAIRFLRDHCMRDIKESINHLHLIPEIISQYDSKFGSIINRVDSPIYCLSSVITIFCHELDNLEALWQIWDFIILHDKPDMVIYIYAATMIYFKDDLCNELSEIMSDDEANDDQHIIQFILSKLIQKHLNNSIDIQLEISSILSLSEKLYSNCPIDHLKSFKNVNKYSVLKISTSSMTILKLQSLNSKALDKPKSSKTSNLIKFSTLVLLLALVMKSIQK